MNLFAGLKGRGADTELDKPTALMTVIVAAMLADNRVEPEERIQIDAICATSPVFQRNSSIENEALIMRATRLIEDHGPDEMCRRAAALLTPALCETAFIYAVKVIFADGHVGRLERELVERLIQQLGIEQGRARALIDAVSVMQHPLDA